MFWASVKTMSIASSSVSRAILVSRHYCKKMQQKLRISEAVSGSNVGANIKVQVTNNSCIVRICLLYLTKVSSSELPSCNVIHAVHFCITKTCIFGCFLFAFALWNLQGNLNTIRRSGGQSNLLLHCSAVHRTHWGHTFCDGLLCEMNKWLNSVLLCVAGMGSLCPTSEEEPLPSPERRQLFAVLADSCQFRAQQPVST